MILLKKLIKKIHYLFTFKKKVKIGSNTRIFTSWFNFGSEPHLISIGSNCTITTGVKFITHDASLSVPFHLYGIPRTLNGSKANLFGKIVINDNCMVGVNTIILKNVNIGPNSIVGAGSLVTKDVLPNSVYAGNPAKFICTIDDYYNKIKTQIVYKNSNHYYEKNQ